MTPDELLERVALPETGDLLVAVSGGPDSAVAAWVVSRLAPHRVRAVHIHHGAAASDALAGAAEAIAGHLGIELRVIDVVVADGSSWEGQARAARWAAIERERRPDETVVTGHHADDLAETTLAHLLRGAGATGLSAMAADRQSVVRPLLDIRRDDVGGVARALQLATIADPANDDRTHTRNLLRHELIPQLQAEINPQISRSLARTAGSLAADDALIEDSIGPVPVVRDAWGACKIPAPLITTAQPATAARLVRRLLRAARPPYAGTFEEVTAGLDVAHGVIGRHDIAAGFHLELEGPWLVVHGGDAPAPDPVECPVPGTADFGAVRVAAGSAPSVLVRRTSLLDESVVGDHVVLRSAAEGERIEIGGGTKPIRDVMAEADIPRRLRSAWPVVEAHARIAAVAGIRSAPWARGTIGEGGTIELTAGEVQL